MSKFVEEKTQGIIIKIINGLVIPPLKYIKKLSCNISIFKYKKESLLLR
jgi:hypothetical protein